FTDGRHAEAHKLSGEYIKKTHSTKQHPCKHCQIQCGKKGVFEGELLPVPEFETTVLLGSNLGVFDPLQNARWNKICTNLGMDTISAGGTLGWVMEATQKGLVASDLAFGKTEGVSEALNDIGYGRGFGKEMGMGSRSLAEKYGGKEFAIQVKGMEMAAYDPRGSFGQGLSYATANRGACHLSTSLMILEVFFHVLDPFTSSNKPTMVKYFEDFFAALNSMHTCVFTSYAYVMEPPLVKYSAIPILRQLMTYAPKLALAFMDVSVYSKLWSAITGFKLSMRDFLKAGERIHVLERYMNTREGLSAQDDTLPDKLLKQPRACDPTGKVVPLDKMLGKYYKERQFDQKGMPTERLLSQLGIEIKPA
ncbi:MAG: aldehyde ferredoxin oxidoreductase, partial [SAR324 cluster bacterium]|nr:aldehyde ferredoxin oxidoreductase [SAR324 cluster bacterium]